LNFRAFGGANNGIIIKPRTIKLIDEKKLIK
jgi:hypothetical protein